MGSAASTTNESVFSDNVTESDDGDSSFDEDFMNREGYVRDVNSELYNKLGIHAPSYVKFPADLQDSSFVCDNREKVMVMARNLQKLISENEAMSQKIDEMKRNLRYFDFGIGICRKAQEESARKMIQTRKNVQKKKIQVRPDDAEFAKEDKEVQSPTMQEVLIEYATSAICHPNGLEDLQILFQKAGAEIASITPTNSETTPFASLNASAMDKQEFQNLASSTATMLNSIKSTAVHHHNSDVTILSNDERELEMLSNNGYTNDMAPKMGSKLLFATFPLITSLIAYGVLFFHLIHILHLKEIVRNMQVEAASQAQCNQTLRYCKPFLRPSHITVVCPEDLCTKSGQCKAGTTCSFSCKDWHRLSSKTTSTTCLKSGVWDLNQIEISKLTCNEVKCSEVQDRDCANLLRNGLPPEDDGTYIVANCRTFQLNPVYCDNTMMGGGWTVVQSRVYGKADFYRTYNEFEQYFGSPSEDYWIGLENLHLISKTDTQSLLVLMTDWNYQPEQRFKVAAYYENFRVESRDTGYQLKVSGYRSSLPDGYVDAGESLSVSNEMQFTTSDSDRDRNVESNCAELTQAAWWHRQCTDANLNARISGNREYGDKAMYWNTWRVKASLKEVRMLTRPRNWLP